jgi:hypothetical protein
MLSQVLRPIITGLPMVFALNRLRSVDKPPRQSAIPSDDAVFGNRRIETDLHR